MITKDSMIEKSYLNKEKQYTINRYSYSSSYHTKGEAQPTGGATYTGKDDNGKTMTNTIDSQGNVSSHKPEK